ncbi:Uncharacterized protein Rs2_06382 [Raphanus sativus]|nr:Uncharacterized protein Rs2_06382 [Raphanus sativus]
MTTSSSLALPLLIICIMSTQFKTTNRTCVPRAFAMGPREDGENAKALAGEGNDELTRLREQETLIKSMQLQLSDTKINLADRQAPLEKQRQQEQEQPSFKKI